MPKKDPKTPVINVETGRPNPIYFDIETGGFWPTARTSLIEQAKEGIKDATARPSSILSISYAEGAGNNTLWSQPTKGSWVSKFSEINIVPQLEVARQAGEKIQSEKEIIQGFIQKMRASPGAPLVGYNIAGFDMAFLQGRAGEHGLGQEFRRLSESRVKIDVGFEVRDLMSSAINRHISDGVFSAQLGGSSFEELERQYFGKAGYRSGAAPLVAREAQNPDFKILSQVRGFQRGGYQGRVEGWKLAPTFEMFAEYAKIENNLSNLAHQAQADVAMTKILHQGIESGKFQEFVDRPEFGQEWLQNVHKQRAGGGEIPKTAGSFYTRGPSAVPPPTAAPTQSLRASVWQKASLPSGRDLKVLGGVGAALLGAGVLYTAFSGYDDSYNTIEGLNHRGLAKVERQARTDFGSGYTGINLQGLPIDEEIMDFRTEVLLDKDKKADLKQELRELELEAQAQLGSFETSDFMPIEESVLQGINTHRKDLRRVNLDRFNIEIEDADSLILRRKGLFSQFFGKDILVRLAGIDAPEVGGHGVDPIDIVRWKQNQAGGEEATEALQARVADATDLDLIIGTQDKTYGRYLGSVLADSENVNVQMARSGMVSALPFGDATKDIVNRNAVARAERAAQRENAGIHQMARYKAIEVATEAAGRDITYNTLTRLDKLGENLKTGRYATFLEGMGDSKRDLTMTEEVQAVALGKSLRNQYSFKRKSPLTETNRRLAAGGRNTDSNRSGYVIPGMAHGGMAGSSRSRFGFGSPWRGLISVPRIMQNHLKMTDAFGATAPISKMMESVNLGMSTYAKGHAARGVTSSLSDAPLYKQMMGFKSQLEEAASAGHKNIVMLNQDKIASFAKKNNYSSAYVTKHTIKHERIHFKNAVQHGDTPIPTSFGPDDWNRALSKSSSYANKPEEWGEEFVANLAGQISNPVKGISAGGTDLSSVVFNPQSQLSPAMSKIAQLSAKTKSGIAEAEMRLLMQLERSQAKMLNQKPIPSMLAKSKEGWRTRYEEFYGRHFSGRDDFFNTIEGLPHGGQGQLKRKELTPFGSGWDALRQLATKHGEDFGSMIAGKEFQAALGSAKQGAKLGEGGLGVVHKMTGTFKGQEFSFARKTALKEGGIGEFEVSVMKQFQDDFAPTVYGSSKSTIDMELFEGRTLKSKMRDTKGISTDTFDMLKGNIKKMHQKGVMHGDLHADNVFVTPQGKVGVIDFGLSGKIGTDYGIIKDGAWEAGGIVKPGGSALGRVFNEQKIGMKIYKSEEGISLHSQFPGHRPNYGYFTKRDADADVAGLLVAYKGIGKSSHGTAATEIVDYSTKDVSTQVMTNATALHRASLKKLDRANMQKAAISKVTAAAKYGGKRSRQ